VMLAEMREVRCEKRDEEIYSSSSFVCLSLSRLFLLASSFFRVEVFNFPTPFSNSEEHCLYFASCRSKLKNQVMDINAGISGAHPSLVRSRVTA